MNKNYKGTEWCPHCEYETEFIFNPEMDVDITCSHCGKKIMPCSLCNTDIINCEGGKNCIEKIKASLIEEKNYCN